MIYFIIYLIITALFMLRFANADKGLDVDFFMQYPEAREPVLYWTLTFIAAAVWPVLFPYVVYERIRYGRRM